MLLTDPMTSMYSVLVFEGQTSVRHTSLLYLLHDTPALGLPYHQTAAFLVSHLITAFCEIHRSKNKISIVGT